MGWYNGHPELTKLNPPLDSARTVSIIGENKTALDLASILLGDPHRLRYSDITKEALKTLKQSKVKNVRIISQLGVLQSRATHFDLRRFTKDLGVMIMPIEKKYLDPYRPFLQILEPAKKQLINEMMLARQFYKANKELQKTSKTLAFEFLLSPSAFYESRDPRLLSVSEMQVNVLDQADIESPTFAVPTGEKAMFKNELVLNNIGTQSIPLDGMYNLGIRFDNQRGIIPNVTGRVLVESQHQGFIPGQGLYVAGGVKSGSAGSFESTKFESYEVAKTMVEDYYTNNLDRSMKNGFDGVARKIQQSTRIVSWADWKKIDKTELEMGRMEGKARFKLQSVGDMLKAID